MALDIRPIPTLTGQDAERFIAMAEHTEKNPHVHTIDFSDEDFNKIIKNAILNN